MCSAGFHKISKGHMIKKSVWSIRLLDKIDMDAIKMNFSFIRENMSAMFLNLTL